jgi:PKD repeat protein
MRKLLFAAPLLAIFALSCKSKPPVGPGVVTITETTTSTTTSTTTTSTIPEPTVADFTFSPITPEVLQIVTVDASLSKPGTGRAIVSYSWDFGDGVIKSGIRATHDYTPSGVYLITLTVTDDQGKKTMASKPITVRPIVP